MLITSVERLILLAVYTLIERSVLYSNKVFSYCNKAVLVWCPLSFFPQSDCCIYFIFHAYNSWAMHVTSS